jgi:hypothetical protein
MFKVEKLHVCVCVCVCARARVCAELRNLYVVLHTPQSDVWSYI